MSDNYALELRMQESSILDFLEDRLDKNPNSDTAKMEYLNAALDYNSKYSTVAKDAEIRWSEYNQNRK